VILKVVGDNVFLRRLHEAYRIHFFVMKLRRSALTPRILIKENFTLSTNMFVTSDVLQNAIWEINKI
jgi:hypothetical protein